MGHHHIGHRPRAQAAHAVGQHHRWHAPDLLEALRQQPQRGLPPLISSDAHEAVAAPGQHRAEQVQPPLRPPVDHQMLPRHGHPGPIRPALPPPHRFGLGHGPAQAARRAGIACRLRHRQQPLCRDPSVRGLHPLRDQHPHAVGRPGAGQPSPRLLSSTALPPLHNPLHRLVTGAAQRGRAAIAPQFRVRIDNIHHIPHRLHWASPSYWSGFGWHLYLDHYGGTLATSGFRGVGTFRGHYWRLYHGHGQALAAAGASRLYRTARTHPFMRETTDRHTR